MITFIVQYLFVTYVKRTVDLQKLINILFVPTLSLGGLSSVSTYFGLTNLITMFYTFT